MIDKSGRYIIDIGLSTTKRDNNQQNIAFEQGGCCSWRRRCWIQPVTIGTKVNYNQSLIVETRKTSLDRMRPLRDQPVKPINGRVNLIASPLLLSLLLLALSSSISINCASCKYNNPITTNLCSKNTKIFLDNSRISQMSLFFSLTLTNNLLYSIFSLSKPNCHYNLYLN